MGRFALWLGDSGVLDGVLGVDVTRESAGVVLVMEVI